jgi:hypothetical protein
VPARAPRHPRRTSCPAGVAHAPRLLLAAGLAALLVGGGCATPTPDPPTGPPPAAPPEVTATAPLPAAPPARIRIPAIDVDSALIPLGLQDDGTLEVPADGAVAGWYTGAPLPGERGPAVIAAHVDWNHAPGVFFRLRDLAPDDEVDVERQDGSTARFEVLKVEQYPKDEFPT